MAKVNVKINAVNQTQAAFQQVANRLVSLQNLAVKATKVFAGVFAIRAGARFVQDLINTGDQLQKMSIQAGISVEALSQMQFAADRSGVSVEALGSSLLRMRRRIGLAAKETGAANEALKQLGLDASKLANLSTEDQFEIIADSISKIKDASTRAGFAFEIFGTQGQLLLPLLADGSKGIQQLRQEADTLGITMSQKTADGFAKAQDALTDMKSAVTGLVRELTVNLGPGVADIVNFTRKAFSAMANAIRIALNAVISLFNKGVAEILKPLRKIFQVLSSLPDWLGQSYKDAFGRINKTIKKFEGNSAAALKGAKDSYKDLIFTVTGATEKGVAANKKFAEAQERTAKLTAKVYDENIKKAAQAKLAAKKLTDEQKKLLKEQEKALQDLQRVTDSWGDRTLDAFERVREGGKFAFKDMVTSMLHDLQRLIVKKTVVDPIFNALGASLDDVFGGILGTGGGPKASPARALPVPTFGVKGFADGGRPPVGRPSLVGERGPELFMPDTAGTVIPNNQIRGGQTNVTIEIINQTKSDVQAEQGQSYLDVDGVVQTVILKDLKKGGPISRNMQSVFNVRRQST